MHKDRVMANGLTGLFIGSKASKSDGIQRLQDAEGKLEALNRSQAVIEFKLDGTIRHANENFLNVMGYRLEEVKGQHHSIFVDPSVKSSPDYTQFWQRLNRGEFIAEEFKRLGKGGTEIWIQASYNPILNSDGNPVKWLNSPRISPNKNSYNRRSKWC